MNFRAVCRSLLTSAVQRSLFIIRRFLPATPPRRLARRSLGGGGSGLAKPLAIARGSVAFHSALRIPHSALLLTPSPSTTYIPAPILAPRRGGGSPISHLLFPDSAVYFW